MRVPPTATHAAHLLTRAAWVATPEAIDRVTTIGIEATVTEFLDADPATPPAEPQPGAAPDEELYSAGALISWFFDLAVSSPTPAVERLLWFWHGHFATSLEKVELPSVMFRQFTTLRDGARGSFAELVRAITFDPAMNFWLDLEANVAGSPNENYARELLELFTMGRDNGYTQSDIVDLARALTGIQPVESCDERPEATWLDPELHDAGAKTSLGLRGRLGPDDVLPAIADRPESHSFVAERLWLRYAGTPIPPAVRRDLAAAFAASGEIRDVLYSLLTHPTFYATEVQNGLVAAPVETLVRTYRGLEIPVLPIASNGEPDEIVWYSALLGQLPAHPPHVGGWPHNHAWLDAANSGNRSIVGRALGWRLLEEDVDSEPIRRIRNASSRPDLLGALADGFGVLAWSTATTAALTSAAALPDEERFVAAIATAFVSPEVTLS